ncbi:MAG: hypothetical protein U5R31_07855 [Acidimicrobiia bacterium]|nr:hypothetical protein [Acidimicrobiia bacterium]
MIQKKIMGPTLLIESVAGATMTAKALSSRTRRRGPRRWSTSTPAGIGSNGASRSLCRSPRRRRSEKTSPGNAAPAPADASPPPAAAPDTTPARPPAARRPRQPPARIPPPSSAPVATGPEADASERTRPTHKHVLLAMLDELHAAGVLTRTTLAAKQALLEGSPALIRQGGPDAATAPQ